MTGQREQLWKRFCDLCEAGGVVTGMLTVLKEDVKDHRRRRIEAAIGKWELAFKAMGAKLQRMENANTSP